MRCLLLVLLPVSLVACAAGDDPTPDGDGDADTDADADSDGDADGDGDGDTEAHGASDGGADGDGDGDGDADSDGDADLPREEVCNGEDDDQDGEIDEGDPGGGFICRTGAPGICADGRSACIDGAIDCLPEAEPGTEECANFGRDDDCNGTVDDIVGLGDDCETGLDGVCAAGTVGCDGAEQVCAPNSSPSPEVCPNERDDDCNGEVDDGIVLVAETCANLGRDDDCNGLVDDIPGLADACDSGLLGICGPGAMVCEAGALVCRALRSAVPEQCPNGDDDDCNGLVDDGIVLTDETCANPGDDDDCNGIVDDVPGLGLACDTGTPGVCAAGIGRCDRAELVFVCVPDEVPTDEICASLADEDCDGETDEAECLACEPNGALDELEPNDDIDSAQRVLCLPITIAASHGGCDADVFEIPVLAQGTYRFETQGGCRDIDTTLWLYDEAGVELEMNDDWNNLCSRIEADLEPGTYFIQELPYDAWVGDVDCREGDYDLVVEEL